MKSTHVIDQDPVLHGPPFERNPGNRVEDVRVLVLKVVWVGDLARSPDALVGRVVDLGCEPTMQILVSPIVDELEE